MQILPLQNTGVKNFILFHFYSAYGKNMPQNLWKSDEARRLPDLDCLICRRNLRGRDRTVVNIYSGTTNAKLMTTDHVGRQVEVLAVKASGSDIFDRGVPVAYVR